MEQNKLVKVTVLYNEIQALPYQDSSANLTVDGAKDDAVLIAKSLAEKGYTTDLFQLTNQNQTELKDYPTTIFFNLCDGIGDVPNSEAEVPRLLESYGRFYTGAGQEGMIKTTQKAQTKAIFSSLGALTPEFAVVNQVPTVLPSGLSFPLFVKPQGQDCSIGITQESVVEDLISLQREVKRILDSYAGSVLIERYIEGREVNLTLVDNGLDVTMLPISEIVFGDEITAYGERKFVDFNAKWEENSITYKNTVGKCPADLPKEVHDKIKALALKIYPAVGARDYARIDIRLSADLTPYFLEVNVNPDLSLEAGAFRSATAAGWDYPTFMEKIVKFALKRYSLSQ